MKGLCEECFKNKYPIIKEVKPFNIKFCNKCFRILIENKYYPIEEVENVLNKLIKKYVIINEGYKLKKLEVQNVSFESGTLKFNIEAEADIETAKE